MIRENAEREKKREGQRKLLGMMEKDGGPALLTTWIREPFASSQHPLPFCLIIIHSFSHWCLINSSK